MGSNPTAATIQLNRNTMGRYISTGIVYQYCFEKQQIESEYHERCWERKSFSEMKEELIKQLFPEIYNYREDDDNVYFTLSDSVRPNDLLNCIKGYYSIVGFGKNDAEEIEGIEEVLKDKTIDEAYEISEEKPSYLFQSIELGYRYQYYAYPLVIEGKRFFCEVHVSIIMIDSSSAKTMTEDDLLSYDFFTDLLRYRMKPDKLANAMIIFLSP